MISTVACTRWNTGGQWTSLINTVRMRISIKKVYHSFANSVSPEAKREIEELDAKEEESAKAQEGINSYNGMVNEADFVTKNR